MPNPTAFCLVRDKPHYRRQAFISGLQRAGYRIELSPPRQFKDCDLLLIWNRYGHWHNIANQAERAGASVLVAENGYLNMRGTKKTIALALDHHNGAGRIARADGSRAHMLDIELQPWREGANDILLLPQRGIGPPGVAMPRNWTQETLRKLPKLIKRFVRVRPHPGNNANVKPLESDLQGIGMVVIWGSGAGLKAVCAGIPVIHELEQWVGRDAARYGLKKIHEPYRGCRNAMLERVAWSQWTIEEIETGEPFKRLLLEDGKS